MDLISIITNHAKKHRAKIGIGCNETSEGKKVISNSAKKADELGFGEIEVFSNETALINALKNGEIDGGVRGNLSAKDTFTILKSAFELNILYRSALICINDTNSFFLAPVGIDEGIFIDERFEFIKLIDPMFKNLGVVLKIAIISGGRMPEDLGRSGVVDESLKAGEKLYNKAKDIGYNVKHYGILIEDAYKESNVIIAPNGIVGNLMFRTLHFLGKQQSYGAPVLNLPKLFIDTSRNKQDYTGAIMLASALSR